LAKASPSEFAPVTILVVDDEPQIVSTICKILCQYRILTATSGMEALECSEHFAGEIHLLLSDFQMPGMSGMDLATQITLARPNIQVLLMSGYPGGMLVLNEGWHFLAKPFIPSQLRSLIEALVSKIGR
jgi:CheY-like chemotaxis protein